MDLPVAFSHQQIALNPNSVIYATAIAAIAASTGRIEDNTMGDFASVMFWKLENLEAEHLQGKTSSEEHHRNSIVTILTALLPTRPLPKDPHGLISLKTNK